MDSLVLSKIGVILVTEVAEVRHFGTCNKQRNKSQSLLNETEHDWTNKLICAPNKDRSARASIKSDQSICCPHEETLDPKLPIERKRGLWSDWTDAQADLNLRLAHRSLCCCFFFMLWRKCINQSSGLFYPRKMLEFLCHLKGVCFWRWVEVFPIFYRNFYAFTTV